jgi:hypothetical protein
MTAAAEERVRAARARYAMLCSMLTNLGYVLAGVSLVQPFFAAVPTPITAWRIGGFLFGVALLALALYLVPRGEKP